MQRCSRMVVPYTQAMASPNSPQPSRITACNPFSGRKPRSHNRCDIRLPSRFALCIGHLPIQDLPFATAIGPQPKGHQQHHLLSRSLLALALAFIQLDGVRRGLHPQPNAIELDDSGDLADWFTAPLLQERLDLIDALIERA